MSKPIRVLVIDDHPVVIKGLRGLLASSDDFEPVGEALTGADGIRLAQSNAPDVIVLDLRLSDALAPELCTKLRRVAPNAQVVILTAFDDRDPIQASLRAGASGVLLKDVHDVDMLQALRDIAAGEVVIDARVKTDEIRSKRCGQSDTRFSPLTPREYDVLRLLAHGMSSREIADELSLTTNTVRGYAQSVITKLHVGSRIEALAAAKRLRLI